MRRKSEIRNWKSEIVKLGMLAVALVVVGCAGRRPVAPSPQYAGVTRKVEDVTRTISLIQADSKEVKRLQSESLSLLDRLDYKTTLLLEQ